MSGLRELSYTEVIRRPRKLGFRFYRRGKGSHELWVRDNDGRVIPVPRYKGKTEQLIKEAIELYIETLKEMGQQVPEPNTKAKPVLVAT